MTFAAGLKSWKLAVEELDDPEKALFHLDSIPNQSHVSLPRARILFNKATVNLTLGNLTTALNLLTETLDRDEHLAIAYFQRACVNYKLSRYRDAESDFTECHKKLRGKDVIDYTQLGLRHKLHACKTLYNAGVAAAHTGSHKVALELLDRAAQCAGQRADIIQAAQMARQSLHVAIEFPLFVLEPTDIFHPPKAKSNVSVRDHDFLGKAKVIAALDSSDTSTGFQGLLQVESSSAKSKSAPASPTNTITKDKDKSHAARSRDDAFLKFFGKSYGENPPSVDQRSAPPKPLPAMPVRTPPNQRAPMSLPDHQTQITSNQRAPFRALPNETAPKSLPATPTHSPANQRAPMRVLPNETAPKSLPATPTQSPANQRAPMRALPNHTPPAIHVRPAEDEGRKVTAAHSASSEEVTSDPQRLTPSPIPSLLSTSTLSDSQGGTDSDAPPLPPRSPQPVRHQQKKKKKKKAVKSEDSHTDKPLPDLPADLPPALPEKPGKTPVRGNSPYTPNKAARSSLVCVELTCHETLSVMVWSGTGLQAMEDKACRLFDLPRYSIHLWYESSEGDYQCISSEEDMVHFWHTHPGPVRLSCFARQ